jgi:D-3-phosphoglycerate dehydrogenase
MYKVQTLNKISKYGTNLFTKNFEYSDSVENPDAILLRSFNMHDSTIPESLKAVARAGAGTNNIPIDKCTEKGIVVMNTPGANANAVKELVLLGMLLASRNVYEGIVWAKSLMGKGSEIKGLVEKGKSNFVGNEILGKTLAIIGLGAIGVKIANDAAALGMNVIGCDPYISVSSAWKISNSVKYSSDIDSLLAEADYISLNLPLLDSTKNFINADKFKVMKKGVILLNFARAELIDNAALIDALKSGVIGKYVSDFPADDIMAFENVIPVPHLGASTPEAEDNCAIMAVNQIMDYLENGNITNSVNFPDCASERKGVKRITIANKNVPNIIGQITPVLASANINISEYINKHKDQYAYNIIDIDSEIDAATIDKLKKIEGVVMVRILD